MPIMKFGGSSLADADCFRRVTDIIVSKTAESLPVVVVSAMKGVTDCLISAAVAAEQGKSYTTSVDELRVRHLETAQALLPDAGNDLKDSLNGILNELIDLLHGVELVRECSARLMDLISSSGERMSSLLLAAYIDSRGDRAISVDARDIIRTCASHGSAVVDFAVTNPLIQERLGMREFIAVVTGFIASTEGGITTTLGRNGSDYTAGILGAALNDDVVEIWTDVDGILTADPGIVPRARVIKEISFEEATELSFFGAEVIHPKTLAPVIDKGIPVFIKNTLNPLAPGTRISRDTAVDNRSITGIASIDFVSMITVEGGGMMGTPGIAGRIFTSAAKAGVNIIMITQASSERSISFVTKTLEAEHVAAVLKHDLADAIAHTTIRDIRLENDLEIVAVVGRNMKGRAGLSGRVFGALGNAGVNILAIAQGSTELNISLVIENSDARTAIDAIHTEFIG